MERETKTIVTLIGKKEVVLKTYLVGREKRELQGIFLKGTDLTISVEDKNVKGLSGKLIEEAENLAWKLVIVSIDGKKEPELDVVEEVLNMHSQDYSFVVKEVNKVTSDADFEEKKTA